MNEQLPISLDGAYEIFMLDNRARRFTPKTLEFYRCQLQPFFAWCAQRDAARVEGVTPTLIRSYLVSLQERGLKDTSINSAARAIRAFLNFCVREELIVRSPMRKVAMPRIDRRILPALSVEEVDRLLAACRKPRDRAIVLFLLDTGVRSAEFVNLNAGDVDLASGEVRIRQGKGRKDRVTYMGLQSRKELHKCLTRRGALDPAEALWVNASTGARLTQSGLNQLLGRLGRRAGVAKCNPHSFRRTFALWSLRNGMNIYALARLMGHSDISILTRYLALVDQDLRAAHMQHGAVDSMHGPSRG